MKFITFLIVTIIVLFGVCASGEVYKYVDQKGNVHFTDNLNQVPEDQRPETEARAASDIEVDTDQNDIDEEAEE